MTLCERFSCLPSQLLAEDPELLRLVSLYDLAHPRRESEGTEGMPDD